MPRYAVAIVNHRSYDDLLRCLASVEAQDLPGDCVVVVDHDPECERVREVRERHPQVVLHGQENRGFAAGANLALRLCAGLAPGAEYLLLLNADIELAPDFARRLLAEMETRPDVALASGKLLRDDGHTLDSTGIDMQRSRVFRDRGSERPDRGQFEEIERVFALSGAALMIRSASIAWLEVEGELLDEDFFAYHEDTDLSWRARLLGLSCLYVPGARARHRRGWQRKRWREIDPRVRRHSFKNRYLEMIKNERGAEFLRDLPLILLQELLRLAGAIALDRSRLRAYADVWRLRGSALRKRRIIQARARRLQGAYSG